MKQEDKELLLQDLCSRLPYGVKVLYKHSVFDIDYISSMYEEVHLDIVDNYTIGISEVKPYLFPMSSMTMDQAQKWHKYANDRGGLAASTDWLNAHHFDYRGLIEKGLAIDATELNIY